MKLSIAQLVASFDDEMGLPELAYDATCRILREEIGTLAASLFSQFVEATDGRFYLREGSKDILLEELQELTRI